MDYFDDHEFYHDSQQFSHQGSVGATYPVLQGNNSRDSRNNPGTSRRPQYQSNNDIRRGNRRITDSQRLPHQGSIGATYPLLQGNNSRDSRHNPVTSRRPQHQANNDIGRENWRNSHQLPHERSDNAPNPVHQGDNSRGSRNNPDTSRRPQHRTNNDLRRANWHNGLSKGGRQDRAGFHQNLDDEDDMHEASGQNRGGDRNLIRSRDFKKADKKSHPRDNGDSDRNYRKINVRTLGFRTLEEISQSDDRDILLKISEKKDAFMKLISSSIDKPDMFVLIIQLIAKVCESSFEQLKTEFVMDICNSAFIGSLKNYLMDLPYVQNKRLNMYYWRDQNDFWKNFITFCDCIVTVSPSTALLKCRSLIEATTRSCLEGLKERHEYKLPDEYGTKLFQLTAKLLVCEKENIEKNVTNRQKINKTYIGEPPNSFRQLSIVPHRDDLMDTTPFFRPNIVEGSYSDVEHYLDVQFRLLREDCFGPLREGISQFMENPKAKKYDHIRIYRNVKFIGPYVSKMKIGSIIQLDENTLKRFKKVNWAHSKRFIFGSLLLFTKDNCKSFIVATILDRDVKYLNQGQIPVSFPDMISSNTLYNDDTYIMIESEVYFEPYFQVLKALQDPKFPEHLAMKNYIVHVNTAPEYPAYLNLNTIFKVISKYDEELKIRVLQRETWPFENELGLNYSQLEAYHLALTREFAVIQGPPGTGKTYLGVKVAKTLLNNLNCSHNGCLMMVVCYTNHALDQFLTALLEVTNSMVRIGSQSRNEAMEKINLNSLRKTQNNFQRSRLFNEQRHNLKAAIMAVKEHSEKLDAMNNGLLDYNTIKSYVPEIEIIAHTYNRMTNGDPLKYWLFQNMDTVAFEADVDDKTLDDNIDIPNDVDEDIFARNEIIIDDIEDETTSKDVQGSKGHKMSFILTDAEDELKRLVLCYKKSRLDQEKEILQAKIVNLKSQIHLYQAMSVQRTRDVQQNLVNLFFRNPTAIQTEDRWALYFKWANILVNDIAEKIKPLQECLDDANIAYEEVRMAMDLEILKNIKVIGMTTSGAARLRKLLQALKPKIVIVEEAAEVLEAHIVTSLTNSCEHLILIGDHQQLRPSVSNMRLARHFNIEISLFERMIMNKVHSRRLSVQHRMRPEFAALISPHIYEDLENHPSVELFPNVRGITKNLFFLTHNFKEQEVEDNSSKTNQKEGDMVLRLANYIMQQGYDPVDVTILAAYSGQMFYMRNQRSKYAYLSKVKITVLDNYQGEESKIILLSLVRNNNAGNIGFLGNKNRICVALSRAKEGFYIFGNIEMLQKEDLWKKIANTLKAEECLGQKLELRCESHPTQYTVITCADDFDKVPEGGCLKKCNYNLVPCGHPCPLICHGYDRGHSTTICRRNCERIICEREHVCPLKCSAKCKPCRVMVQKILPCRHSMQMLCHVDPEDPTVKCLTQIPVTLPDCGHETMKFCYLNIKSVVCKVRCVYRVEPCGHECRRYCHVTDDPDHEKYLCEKPCAKAKKGCTAGLDGDRGEHQCTKKCHETCDDCEVQVMKKRSNCKHQQRVPCSKSVDDTPCRQNCARVLPCGHYCRKKCYEKCGDCPQKVKKIIPDCKHEVEVECARAATRDLCVRKCERVLSCGHRCARRCAQPCDPQACEELIPRKFIAPCGHGVELPCNMIGRTLAPFDLLKWCKEPCNEILACEHLCGGTCSGCLQGRIHAPCNQTCNQINICGHDCEEPCNQLCPPCKKPCEVKCMHSECNKLCGAPCVFCREKCTRECRHGVCTNRCGEPCSRPPCEEPCAKRLPCGHPCRGLCGEPCPDICKLCRPDSFPKDFLGDDYEDDDRFVQLQDCNHILEIENMKNLMTGDSDTVKIRTCPFCRKPIINTYRYKDLVNNMYKTEINPIKEKVFGNTEQIKTRKVEVDSMILQLSERRRFALQGDINIKQAFQKIKTVIKNQKKVSLVNLEMQCVYLNILDILGDSYEKYFQANLKELKQEFFDLIKNTCNVLISNTQKISRQQQEDINNEIRRMDAIIQFSKILNTASYMSSKLTPKVKKATDKAKGVVLGWNKFNKDEALECLKHLQDTVNVSGIVTKQERDLIVKAIGLRAGHWYKCPNGHFYCIGECGGAMQVSKCIECGAQIGGQSHALLSTNRHAPEMDGSRNPAWPQVYNDMANFQLDFE